jgi:bis(5'-nucleosyl)-tetraphosphatase (symmetrical)
VAHADGRVDLDYSGPPGGAPSGRVPWFALPGWRTADMDVIFGHWSALGAVHWPAHRAWGLDTGCVWGRRLTALRLDDRRLFSVESRFRGSD